MNLYFIDSFCNYLKSNTFSTVKISFVFNVLVLHILAAKTSETSNEDPFLVPFDNCTSTQLLHASDDELKKRLHDFGVHYNVQPALKVLQDPKYYSNEAVQMLLIKYEEVKQIAPQFLPEKPIRHPIIVIEGFFNHGKTKVTKIVADAVHGRRFQLPNRNINKLRKFLDSDVLKKQFYSLSKYIGAYTAMYYCMTAPVVMERYWHDQAVYVMARSFEGVIPAKSSVYEFPKDLLKPDYIFFLNGALNPDVHNETTIDQHIHNPLTTKMVEVYRRMRNPALIEIFPPGMPEVMAEKILEILEKEIPLKFAPKPAMKPVLRPRRTFRPRFDPRHH